MFFELNDTKHIQPPPPLVYDMSGGHKQLFALLKKIGQFIDTIHDARPSNPIVKLANLINTSHLDTLETGVAQ